MADITTNLTGTAQLDNSAVLAFEQSFLIANGQENVMDALAQVRWDIGAKSIDMTKYARLAAATTPLNEREEVTSAAMSDTQILLTPVEYGNVVTTTALSSLQSGGKVDLASAQVVGINAGETQNALAIAALDASSNAYIIGGTAAGSVTSGQVASRTFFNYFYNKLARANVQKINGDYVVVAHDDVIHDLRADTSAGSWIDVNKYATPETILPNEVGSFAGFRVVRNNAATYADQTGAGTVDLYNSYFFGANAFGKAVSQDVSIGFTQTDKMNRFLNVYWKGVFKYGIIDQDALWLGQSASSVGPGNAI